MRPDNHTASSSPEYTPDELEFLKLIYEHVREKPRRSLTHVDVYRFIKEKGLMQPPEDDDREESYEMPLRSMRRPEVHVDVLCLSEDDVH